MSHSRTFHHGDRDLPSHPFTVSSPGWFHKSMAFVALVGASVLFVAIVVWPVVAPHIQP